MKIIRYSEFPHVFYLDKSGNGPGALFLGDLERWNWRYTLIGTVENYKFDEALQCYFNDAQRKLMRMDPLSVLSFLVNSMPSLVNDGVKERLLESQARFVNGRVAAVDGNVISVLF